MPGDPFSLVLGVSAHGWYPEAAEEVPPTIPDRDKYAVIQVPCGVATVIDVDSRPDELRPGVWADAIVETDRGFQMVLLNPDSVPHLLCYQDPDYAHMSVVRGFWAMRVYDKRIAPDLGEPRRRRCVGLTRPGARFAFQWNGLAQQAPVSYEAP